LPRGSLWRRFALVFQEVAADRETIEMIARLKHKHHQAENDRGNREYWRREKALDEALKNTFPASDPVSVEQPGLPADGVNSPES
jgi:hypothetical protein